MGIKTESVGYCDKCAKQISDSVKGIHFHGILEFLNDKSSYIKDFNKLGEPIYQSLSKTYVLCRACFASVLNMMDKNSEDFKNLRSSHDLYLDSLYKNSR